MISCENKFCPRLHLKEFFFYLHFSVTKEVITNDHGVLNEENCREGCLVIQLSEDVMKERVIFKHLPGSESREPVVSVRFSYPHLSLPLLWSYSVQIWLPTIPPVSVHICGSAHEEAESVFSSFESGLGL